MQKQAYVYKFKASLLYILSSRPGEAFAQISRKEETDFFHFRKFVTDNVTNMYTYLWITNKIHNSTWTWCKSSKIVERDGMGEPLDIKARQPFNSYSFPKGSGKVIVPALGCATNLGWVLEKVSRPFWSYTSSHKSKPVGQCVSRVRQHWHSMFNQIQLSTRATETQLASVTPSLTINW